MQHRAFEVEAGSETRLAVVLEWGVERTLVFVPPPGTTCPSADVLVRSGTWELYWRAHGGEELTATLMLAPGTYEIEATTPVGLAARGGWLESRSQRGSYWFESSVAYHAP